MPVSRAMLRAASRWKRGIASAPVPSTVSRNMIADWPAWYATNPAIGWSRRSATAMPAAPAATCPYTARIAKRR
jgi:hypothetical protein